MKPNLILRLDDNPPTPAESGMVALDEVVAEGMTVHMEMMDKDLLWIGITGPNDVEVHVHVRATKYSGKRGALSFIAEAADVAAFRDRK